MTDKKFDTLNNLFPESQTVSAISIKEYLDWAAHSGEYPRVLAIPPIQRGFVWKPKQIQDLWDSLLRGMPIGSILLKSFEANEKSAGLRATERKVDLSQKPGFHLMDGQQRTLSMLIGFPDSFQADHKLWMDFSLPGTNGSVFRLRVSTPTQPFGYRLDGRRLSIHDRRTARQQWSESDQKKKEMSNQEIFNNAKPWKEGGKNQNYLFEIKQLWKWLNDSNQDIDEWRLKVKDKIKGDSDTTIDKVVEGRITEFGNSLKKLQNQWLALIKIPNIENNAELEEPGHDYLTMLFDRISSNGTRLSPDDLLFSMVKQLWPQAHNLVYEIQKEVGSLMKPTDFVMTAYRLASLRGKEPIVDDPQPNAKSFHKNLGKLLGNESEPGEMLKLIRDGSLVKAYRTLKEVLMLKDEDDYGLPEAMFPYLDVPLLQVILHWILMHDSSNVISEQERKDIVRFVLYWIVCRKDAASRFVASKKAIAKINNGRLFTFMDIYKELSVEEKEGVPSIFCPLIIPDSSIELRLKIDHFRDPNRRAEDFFGKNTELYHSFTTRKALLIWFQRKWMHKKCTFGEFKEFKPLAGQDEDNVPYDFDHLVPQSNWSSFQGGSKPKLDDSNRKYNELWSRRTLGNSIGNYRIMSASDNRSRGDTYLGVISLKNEEFWEDYAFRPSDDEIEQWNKASPEKDPWNWDDERVLAFQYAVESRVLYLYKRYYDEASFKSWLENEPAHY